MLQLYLSGKGHSIVRRQVKLEIVREPQSLDYQDAISTYEIRGRTDWEIRVSTGDLPPTVPITGVVQLPYAFLQAWM